MFNSNQLQYMYALLETLVISVEGGNFKALSHQSGVLTAFPRRSQKLEIAEVRAVQSPLTLWKRYHSAVFILSMLKTNAADWPWHRVLDSALLGR